MRRSPLSRLDVAVRLLPPPACTCADAALRVGEEIFRGVRTMRSPRAALLRCLCVAALLLPLCTPADDHSRYGEACEMDLTDNGCGLFERCKQESSANTSGKCTCREGYEYINKKCTRTPTTEAPSISPFSVKPNVDSNASEGGSSVAAILLVPTFLALVCALMYFGARRYKWLQRFRQFRQNRYGSVLVTRDDTDDDDPPLA